MGVVALADEDGGDPRPPGLLDRGQDTELVVHQHVVLRGEAGRHVVQLPLLVDVDQDPVLDRGAQSRALDLAGLEHHVAVGEDHSRAERSRTAPARRASRERAGWQRDSSPG